MADGIRVLRLIEYVYPDAETAERDMARWTMSHYNKSGRMRSSVLPFETIKWVDGPADWQQTEVQPAESVPGASDG